jgi:hypothetical protein
MYIKKFYFAGTTSDKNGRRMFRSVGPGSNIPSGLSSRRAVPTLSGTNSNILLRLSRTNLIIRMLKPTYFEKK